MANEKQLVIEVRDKIATLKSKNFNLVGGNSDYDVVFDFDDDWQNYPTKTAVFVFGKGVPVFQIFEGNVCKGVAINGATMCLIGAFAGDIKTTTSAEVDCVYKSILDDANGTPEPPTEDVYNQIMDLLNKYIEQGGGGSGGSAVSPTVEITPIENGHRVTITDINGKHTFDVMNGANGKTPQKGVDYWTETDKAEMKAYVDEAILGGEW